jgi:hypothetical protein
MRGGSGTAVAGIDGVARAAGTAARFWIIVALIPAGRLGASPVHRPFSPAAPMYPGSAAPGAVGARIAADTGMPTVDPSHLDHPAELERQLRAALGHPLSHTRLSVVGGAVHLGHFALPAGDTMRGHAVVLEGDADISGRLIGNLVVLDGNVVMHPGGTVAGDALALGGAIVNAAGISGTTQSLQPAPVAEPPQTRHSIAGQMLRDLAGVAGVFLTLVVVGFGLVTFGRPNLEIVSDTVAHSFGRSFLVGLLGQLLVFPTVGLIVLVLALTVAGMVVVPFAVGVYALLVIVASLAGVIAVAHAMGERLARRRMARGLAVSPNSYRYVWSGLLALAGLWSGWVLFGWVPIAGTIALAIAVLGTWGIGTVGFGAALLSRGGIREDFAGRLLPPEMMTDEYLWATPQFGVPAARRPPRNDA